MYAIYGKIYHQYTPVLLASIYHAWILWEMDELWDLTIIKWIYKAS